MSSAYSILHNYQQELYSPNLELINTALQFKQQTLNANREKLQTMYDQYSFLEVAKEEDQEYLEGRLQSVRGVMDKYAALDLSSNNLTNQLVSNMSNVIDDNVENAVISTRIYRSEQEAWSKLSQENPEKYSETNHAYSQRGANDWLTDGTTGSSYRGGGGVIEYIDVQGKLATQIPDIAKNLKAEWVELAGGGGYFRNVLTKERVSRDQLELAMEGILNEQDRKQLQINAWGTYDQMSDQQLEAVYTNHFAPRVNGLQNEIESLQRTVDSTKDPVLKEQRQALLEFYRTQLDAYEVNSFDNVVGNYGREAAYSTLYDNQFRGMYLDAYSYTDRITKIATYDNDVQQRNYEYKLDNLNRIKQKDAFQKALKLEHLRLREEELDLKKLGKTSGKGTKPGEPGYIAPLMGTEAVLEYDETASKINEHQKKNREILDKTKQLFGIETDGEARDLSKIFNEGFAGKEFIEYKGVKINVQENLALLLEFQNNILVESPVEKEAIGVFNQAVGTSLSTLRKITQGTNPDWLAAESTPKFKFGFRLNGETGLMERFEITKTDANPYAYLLRKENLSEEEEFTLGVYHKMHMLMDPELDNDQKELLLKGLQTDEFSKISNADYNTFPTDIHAYNRMEGRGPGVNTTSKVVVGVDGMREDGFFERHPMFKWGGPGTISMPSDEYGDIIEDLGKAYEFYGSSEGEDKKKARDKIQSLEDILNRDQKLFTTRTSNLSSDFYISHITSGDAEYYDQNGNEVSLNSPEEILNRGMDLYANTLETAYKEQDLEPSLYPQIFNTETSGYSNLATLVGLPSGTKVPITLERVWDEENKRPTNEVKWSYQTKIKGNVVTITSEDAGKNLKVDQLRSNGIIDFDEGSQVSYNAAWGENAVSLDLGNNIYDEKIKKENVTRYGANLALSIENAKPLLDDARKFGGEKLFNEIKEDRRAFKEGAYEFKMESIDGVWQYVIYDNAGNRVYNEYTGANGITGYSYQEVNGIFKDSEFIINTIMYNYLYSKIEDASEEYILNYQEEQEKNF